MKFPSIVETTTSFAPNVPLGVVNETDVELFTVTPVAAAPPTVIPVTEDKLVPIIPEAVPPAKTPLDTDNEVSVGVANAGASLLVTGVIRVVDDEAEIVTPVLVPVFVR